MTDLDLLVPPDQLDHAVQRMEAQGWHRTHVDMTPDLGRSAQRHVILERHGPARLPLELHWTLAAWQGERHGPDMDWFWAQREPFDPRLLDVAAPSAALDELAQSSAPLFVLTPTANLLYLSAHLMLHHAAPQTRLLWFHDLHLLVERQGDRVEWEELLRRARRFHWATALGAALQGTQRCFGTLLPNRISQQLAQVDDGQAARLFRRRGMPVQTRVTAGVAIAASLEWRTLVRYIWGTVMPSPAYLRWRYRIHPPWLWPLLYPYRWADLAWAGLSTVWRGLRARMMG